MTHSGRHAATPCLTDRWTERVHQVRGSGPLRRKVLTAVCVGALLAGSGTLAASQSGLLGGQSAADSAAASATDSTVISGRDALLVSRDLARLSLDDVQRVTIRVTVDGQTATHNVPALTLAEALADAGIVVGMFDTVSRPLSETVTEGMEASITRGASGMASTEDVTDFETIEKEDPSLFKGDTRVESEGQQGVTRTTYRVETSGGEEVARTAIASVVVTHKQDRVVLVGSKERPAPVQAAQVRPGDPDGDDSPAPAAPIPAGSAQEIAQAMLGSYGWGDDQMSCLVTLWNRESGWNHLARNPSSGAYGIPQALPGTKMASAGADWRTNPATQIRWGLGYIQGRYGSPCAALNHSYARGWY